MLRVLQVTDCHLFPDPDATLLGVRTHASLNAVLQAARAESAADAVLATGDIAQRPCAETYRLFLGTLGRHFDAPLLCVPGNHDHGATFKAELPTEDLTLDGWRIVGIDTHVDEVVGGTVASGELQRLAAADAPLLVAGHHCPVNIGCAWLDQHRIDNGEALLHGLRDAGAAAYAFGHIHQPFHGGDAPSLLGTPSTCFQFAQGTPSFAIDTARPGYRWLELAEDGSVGTRLRRADFDIVVDLEDRDHP